MRSFAHRLSERLRSLTRSSMPDDDLATLIEEAVTEKLSTGSNPGALERPRLPERALKRLTSAELTAKSGNSILPLRQAMRKLRIYFDTSIFGGVFDREFADASSRLIERVKRGEFTILVSQSTLLELANAPERVQHIFHEIPRENMEFVAFDEEVRVLADSYIQAEVLGEARREDANHIAAASIASADLMLSWNFKHIVRYDRIRKFNGVNALKGYRPLDVRSPLEVQYGESQEGF